MIGNPIELHCEYNRQSDGQNDQNYFWYKVANDGKDEKVGSGRKFYVPRSKYSDAGIYKCIFNDEDLSLLAKPSMITVLGESFVLFFTMFCPIVII